MKNYTIDIKDKVLSDFETGVGVMALSRKHDIPKSTIHRWIKLNEHAHHWVIDAPNGPISSGRCKICGNVKQNFVNSLKSNGYWQLSKKGTEQKEERQKRVKANRGVFIPSIDHYIDA